MQLKKERTRLGREKLQGIIETCRAIEERGLDPFSVDVSEMIKIVREFFPDWDQPEDLCLDAEAINRLASVVKLQSEWVKHHSSSLYRDPFLLEEKLRSLNKESLLEVFLRAWHPIVELEQISIHSLKEALIYWGNLPPIKDRWKGFPKPEEFGVVPREELLRLKILRDKAFIEELENFWNELRKLVVERGEGGRIRYWDFIGAETFEETVYRAFLTSFLVTYGYATLEVYPLEEEIYIKPFEKQRRVGRKRLISLPIAITRDEWNKWRKRC
jgi:hypothetical protein